MLSRRYAAAFLVLIGAFSATYYVIPNGIARAADQKCSTEKAYDTQCDKPQIGKDGKPTGLKGGLNCPCQEMDEVSKKTIIGKCNAKVQCIGTPDETKDAEGRPVQTCVQAGNCKPGETTAPKEGGGAPSLPSPPGSGGSDPKPQTPQPDETPEQKRLRESFEALQPKPDLKPGETSVSAGLITEAELCAQYPTTCSQSPGTAQTTSGFDAKPFTQQGSLWDQALSGKPMAEQSSGFFNTDIQPGSVLNNGTTDAVQKLDGSDITVGEFSPTGGLSEQQRLNAASTFSPQPDDAEYTDQKVRQLGPSQYGDFAVERNESGFITKVSSTNPDMSDAEWQKTVTALQNSEDFCARGVTCLMVNNDRNQELSISFSQPKPGGLPEGSVVINPDSNAMAGQACGLRCTVAGGTPTATEVAQDIYSRGIPVTMPDGSEKVLRLTPNAAAAIAPSVAQSYDSNDTSLLGRAASYTGFNKDQSADATFAARDPVQEPETPSEREPTRITVTPRETVAAEVVTEAEVPKNPTRAIQQPEVQAPAQQPQQQPQQQPTEQPFKPMLPASRPADAPAREATPAQQPAAQPSAQPAAQPSAQPAAQPSGEPASQPSGQPASQPAGSQPSQAQPTQQASNDANLMQRLYCLVFTCEPPQQQAQQPAPVQPQQQPTQQPTQQNPVVAQQPTPVTPTQPVRQNPSIPTPTPSEQPDTSQLPQQLPSQQPETQPQPTPAAPARQEPTQIAQNKASNVLAPVWTPPVRDQTPQPQQTGEPNSETRATAPASANGQPSTAAAPRPSTNPIALNNAAARIIASTKPPAAAPAASRPAPVAKSDTAPAVVTTTDPARAVPTKTDVAVNNPKAGGTAGSPDVTKPDATPRTAEPDVQKGDAGKISDQPKAPSTPNPEVKKPTVGPSPTGKVGTGGSGTGSGTGVGNGDGSEAGIQAPSSCGVKCLAQKALTVLAGLTGVTPAVATPSPTMTASDAKKQIDEKLKHLTEAMEDSKKLGETEAALIPLKRALELGREVAEIANKVNDPGIKALAGDVNKKVLDLQDIVRQYDTSSGWNDTWGKAIARMKREMPTKVPAAINAVNELTKAVNTAAEQKPAGGTVATNVPKPPSVPVPTPNTQTVPGQPQTVANPAAKAIALPRVPGNINSQGDRASVAQQTYDLLREQGIKPADLTRGSPNYAQAWKSTIETTRQVLNARGMLHEQLDVPAVLSVVRQETGVPGNRNEFTSTTGVRGYMQVTGDTAVGVLGNRNFKTDAFQGPWEGTRSFARENNIGSVITGAMLFNQLLHQHGGNLSAAGQSYNSGSPNSCSGQGCRGGVPTYGPAVARDTQVMRAAVQNATGNPSGIVDGLRSMDPNRSVRQNDLGAYASILSGAELGPLTPLKCAYQGCAATPTIAPGNRGYSPSVNRVAEAPTSGLYYRDPQTGAIGVPIDPEMSREEFIRAAREDVAMERLAQNNKLPQGSAFQNFKATRVEGAAGAAAPQPQVVINPNHKFDTRYSYASIKPASERGGFVAQGPNTPSRLNNTMDGGRLPWGSNPEIYKPLEAASKHLPPGYTVSITNSGRHDHSHNHGTFINGPDGRVARASDMVIYDPNGKPLANIQSPQNFQIYRELAQNWKHYHDQMYPDRSNLPRWGGGFTDVQADLMHLDLNAARGNGAFSWERGLSASYAQFGTPDQVGVGMGNTATYQPINQSAVGPGTTGVGVQDTRYDIVNESGETVAQGVPLPDGTVAGDGTVRLLSNKDGAPLNSNGEDIKDGEKPLQISSDRTLPKPTEDRDGLTFKDERPTQPRTEDPWRRGGQADPYPRTGPRPTSYCVDNNGRLYGCTPTGGSNPTGGTRPGGGAPSMPTSQPQYPAQQFPRQNPTLPPYTFPPTTPVPPPIVVPPLTPALSCSPSSVPFGTTTPVTVSWSCLTGTASSTGFATGGAAVGRATLNSSSRATSSMRFFLQCVSGARISPVATCSIPVAVPPAPSVSLTADPNPVDEGGSAVVIWGSSNASKCSLRATSTMELIDGSTDGATSTSPLFMTTPVTLTCTNAAGITSSTSISIRVR